MTDEFKERLQSWLVEEFLKLMQCYSSGITLAIIASELEQNWVIIETLESIINMKGSTIEET